MIRTSLCVVAILIFVSVSVFAQAGGAEPTPTPVHVVVTNSMPPPKTIQAPKPIVTPIPTSDADDADTARLDQPQSAPATPQYHSLSFAQVKRSIADAKREMATRPLSTAMVEGTDGTGGSEFVRVAFHDWHTNKLDYIVMTKDMFLSPSVDKEMTSQNGRYVRTRTIRPNGVNTPIVIFDDKGNAQLPILVQFPVIRQGKYMETAYYMSTHPGLVTPEIVNAGRFYVRNVIEIAREKLSTKGFTIQPKVADIAERLATVEHVDHLRFKTEYHPNIYNDIYTLYALNEGQTYRYSVSSAGAGGMVQMIPATYRMIRSRFPGAGLMPDFVEGMRDHVNASQAMLLYMQMTWDDLIASPTVSGAVISKVATQEQLIAAGYNSNPARIAGYINRGGDNWTSLIPRETQIYLQIFKSLEQFVPLTPRTK